MTVRRKTLRLAITLSFLLAVIWLISTAPPHYAQDSQRAAEFERLVQPFLAKTCYHCHNAEIKSGGLNLQLYKTASITSERAIWEHVLSRLRAGEMPPKGMPRPADGELKAVISSLEKLLEQPEETIKPDAGRVTARRLNRAEYNNTVRDLLGVDFRPADEFPQDDSGYGFDNIADVLSLSPVLMEKYLAAAEKVARAAVYGPEVLKPTLIQLRAPGGGITPSAKPLFDYDETGLSLPNAFHVTHNFPVTGEYRFRAFLGGVRPAGSEPLRFCLWIDGKSADVVNFDPDLVASFAQDKQELGGATVDFRARLSAGEHWVAVTLLRLYEGLPSNYRGPNPSKRPVPPPRQFNPPRDASPEKVAELRKRFEAALAEKVPVNEARVNHLTVAGPYGQLNGPSRESLKKIYACGHLEGRHRSTCAHMIVSGLARRAFRRPVTTQEITQLLNLISAARRDGESFEEGICVALQAMLVSPHFLFRIDRPFIGDATAHPITQHQLASRLSYYLWSSTPDDELMRCADQGILRQDAVLAAQVRRMLKDEKSRALVENFGGQWLELRKIESVKPDRKLFPEFEEYLRWSMRRETELFLESLIREDGSILDLINARYTFLNDRLARFYNIPNVTGTEFRKVPLDEATHRGGVLTQASILTVSSYATRTSPVLRGRWILENILNSPPPPPPPDVPNLDEAKVSTAASLRTQLEEHRQNATCASCHLRMDPLGFGLENFDAIGRWRSEDGKLKIDASGTLPDGRSFRGPAELKSTLMSDRDAFVECLTEKMLTYALGRGLERYDRPTVKAIAGQVAANQYRFSNLVLQIVKSLPFQMRRGEPSL